MDIVKRNLFALIRSGALGEYTRLEPMTPCKWRKLGDMALSRGVAPTVSLGLRHHQYDQGLGIPSLQLGDGEVTSAQTTIPMRQASMANLWLNHQLKRIRNTERHAIDTSVETLQMLDILLSSITAMMGQDASLRHLVQLAIYLRTRGDKVDFVKLDRWLQKLHVTRAAALQGSFLITAMGFKPDELPFVHSSEPRAEFLLDYALSHGQHEYEAWHLSDTKPLFIRNNPKALWRRVRRCARYMRYAPLETISYLFLSMARSIAEVEE